MWWKGKRQRPQKQQSSSAELFDLEVPDEDVRTYPAVFLIREKGWPASFVAASGVGVLFTRACVRRYEEHRGVPPEWDRGPVFRGYVDWLIVSDTYEEEMGALAEQLAYEGRPRRSWWVADDPSPEYSRLDRIDGLGRRS